MLLFLPQNWCKDGIWKIDNALKVIAKCRYAECNYLVNTGYYRNIIVEWVVTYLFNLLPLPYVLFQYQIIFLSYFEYILIILYTLDVFFFRYFLNFTQCWFFSAMALNFTNWVNIFLAILTADTWASLAKRIAIFSTTYRAGKLLRTRSWRKLALPSRLSWETKWGDSIFIYKVFLSWLYCSILS